MKKKVELPRLAKEKRPSDPLDSLPIDDGVWDEESAELKDDDVEELDTEMIIEEGTIEEAPLDDEPTTDIEPYDEEEANNMGDASSRNLESGMELLELDFLLSVVEETEGEEKNDVAMRKFSFNELIRTNRVNHVDSLVLKYYTVDEKQLYSREIQCAAMAELTDRTLKYGANAV
jgi:hypothetical protein